ncbi:MAG: TIGR03757 family integrating conjugative element protein [Pseudomonadales bacterium]|jgi:integrating conjugative element protein (TIGR03757 family)|nr:TIGR03757 family integrating conjugative element protein [Pseudomonadales bacterium]
MLAISHALVAMTLLGPLLFSTVLHAGDPLTLEVFTTAEFPVSGQDDRQLQGATVTVYAVDGLDQFESALSHNLPAVADAAKAEALRRIGELSDARMTSAKDAAIGLAKIAQYGVDRYPAVVVNGTAVVYGVTNLVDAAALYEAWQMDQSR